MKKTSLKKVLRISRTKGFTFVEMIVSVALFIVVALVAVGALIKVIDANKKSISLKTTINNVNFALESMSREIRVGSHYYCDDSNVYYSSLPSVRACSTRSDWSIHFKSTKTALINPSGTETCNLIFAYRYANNTLEKAEQTSCGQSLGNSDFAPIISSDIHFDIATLRVDAAEGNASFAQFHLKGYSGEKEKSRTYFDLQTSVAQRISDQ